METPEGVYELHWQRREYGQLFCQLYRRLEHGQLSLVDAYVAEPFSTALDAAAWVCKRLELRRPPLVS